MATAQLEGEVLQLHIKEAVNPRPQLPQRPQHSTHTHTELSPSQTRIEQAMIVPQTRLIPLASDHHQDPLSSHRWNAATSSFRHYRQNVRNAYLSPCGGFPPAEFVSQGSILYYLCVHACLCVHTSVFPVVQTWVVDVTDKPVSMHAVCVGQDVPLQQMHNGFREAALLCERVMCPACMKRVSVHNLQVSLKSASIILVRLAIKEEKKAFI